MCGYKEDAWQVWPWASLGILFSRLERLRRCGTCIEGGGSAGKVTCHSEGTQVGTWSFDNVCVFYKDRRGVVT